MEKRDSLAYCAMQRPFFYDDNNLIHFSFCLLLSTPNSRDYRADLFQEMQANQVLLLIHDSLNNTFKETL